MKGLESKSFEERLRALAVAGPGVDVVLSIGTWRSLKTSIGLNGLWEDSLWKVLHLQDVVIGLLQGTDVSSSFFYPVNVVFSNKSSRFLAVFSATRAAGDR